MMELNLEQRFAITRARYEVRRMSRPALEKVALRLLRSKLEQKNGVQHMLRANGILLKIEESHSNVAPDIMSEETFLDLLRLNEDEIPIDIDDVGWEEDDLDDDDLMLQ